MSDAEDSNTWSVALEINGVPVTRKVDVRTTLADFLRHEVGLTGTHVGCEHGACGACTVLVDGRSMRSCLLLAVQLTGLSVRTVESLAAADGTLSDLQQAFKTYHGLQCGFCTPGMLMTLTELLAEGGQPSEAEVRTALSGNMCRCTGYAGIVDAALSVIAARPGKVAPR